MSGGTLLAVLKGIFLLGFVAAVLLHARLKRPAPKKNPQQSRRRGGSPNRQRRKT